MHPWDSAPPKSLKTTAVVQCISAVVQCISAVVQCISAVVQCISAVVQCISAVVQCISAVVQCISAGQPTLPRTQIKNFAGQPLTPPNTLVKLYNN